MQSSTPPPPSPSATGPTASEGGARVSLEREPWRALRPSIAIGFSSWRRGDWSPDAPSEDFRRDAIAGIETARAIARRV